MKMGFGLIAVATMLVVVAAPPAFARNRHSARLGSRLDSQEMRITESPTSEPIVGPPVTVPDGSIYDTPLPKVVAALPPLPRAGEKPQVTASVVDGGSQSATDTTSVDRPSAPAAPDALDGAQTASITVPAPSERAKQEVAGPPAPSQNSRTPGSILFDQTRDDSALDPMNWAVSVYKKRHDLTVYYKGRLFKKYEAVFGRNVDLGAKLWAQDRRTPEGVYNIVEKYPSSRFRWFLRLNYPNLIDRVRYETMRINGVVPIDSKGKLPEVGSAIGIHGTDIPILNAGRINWTTGCISVNNRDIDDLDRLLPVGTVVIIKP